MSDSINRHKFVLSLSFFHLILKIIDLFSFSLVVSIYFLNQPISSREVEYLNRRRKKRNGHCPKEIYHLTNILARRMNSSLIINSIVFPPFPYDKFTETMRLILMITSVNRFCLPYTSDSIEINTNQEKNKMTKSTYHFARD